LLVLQNGVGNGSESIVVAGRVVDEAGGCWAADRAARSAAPPEALRRPKCCAAIIGRTMAGLLADAVELSPLESA
jgi:hypothetical protein